MNLRTRMCHTDQHLEGCMWITTEIKPDIKILINQSAAANNYRFFKENWVTCELVWNGKLVPSRQLLG